MRSVPIKQRFTIKAAALSQKPIPVRAVCLCRIEGLDVCYICFRSVFLLHYSNLNRQLPLKKRFTQMMIKFLVLAEQIPLFATAQWACFCHWSRAKGVLIRPCRHKYIRRMRCISMWREKRVFIDKLSHLSPGGTETHCEVECVMPKDTFVLI